MSFEMNKIAGAILAAMILAMVSGLIASNLVKPVPLAKPAYVVASAEPSQAKPEDAAKAAAPEPIEPLLASANVDAGKDVAKKCQLCHTFDKGGANKIGPNLYGVVGRPIASHPGFAYSDDLSKHKADSWTYDNLNIWLSGPKAFAPGTKMGYAGDKDDSDRANIIAYLSTLSHSPVPFPAPAAASSAEPAASATSAAPAEAASSASASSEASSAQSSAASQVDAASSAASAASGDASSMASSSAAQ